KQSLRLPFTAGGARPPAALAISAALFPYDDRHQTFVNVYDGGALRHQAILGGGRTTVEYFSGSPRGTLAIARRFVGAGIHHILIGPDHLLFLVGLLLLGGSIRKLALVVTAFTLAHSVTLSVAARASGLPSRSAWCTASGSPACCARWIFRRGRWGGRSFPSTRGWKSGS